LRPVPADVGGVRALGRGGGEFGHVLPRLCLSPAQWYPGRPRLRGSSAQRERESVRRCLWPKPGSSTDGPGLEREPRDRR
jgi:hypothetical protein